MSPPSGWHRCSPLSARTDQIAGARDAFLLAIAREFGYAARNIAARTLGDGNKVDVPFVKMALRVVPSFDAKELVAAAKTGDGRKFAEQLSRFIATTNAMLTDKAELKSIEGSDDYSAFMGTAADLLFVVNPDLVETVRGLDADTRGKLFEDAERASSDKSSAIQAQAQAEADKQQARIVAHEARY